MSVIIYNYSHEYLHIDVSYNDLNRYMTYWEMW